MDSKLSSYVNFLSVFFGGIGNWFVLGEALARFVSAEDISGSRSVEIGVLDVADHLFDEKANAYGVDYEKLGNGCYSFIWCGIPTTVYLFGDYRKGTVLCPHTERVLRREWFLCTGEELESVRRKKPDMTQAGYWRRPVDPIEPYYLNLPYCYGTILDEMLPRWYLKVPKRPFPTTGDIFFDKKRRENGRKLISGLYDAAEKAGIAGEMFAGFGTTLGYLMYGDFIPKDRDMDMCFLADDFTKEQYETYAKHAYEVDPGRKPPRWENAKREDGKYCWISVGYKNPTNEHGCKSCNWFFFSFDGMWLHSKGGRWVNPKKINTDNGYSMDDDAIALGLPKKAIENLVEVDFNGIKINIPEKAGTCCDRWYPGWCPRGEGASAHRQVVIIKNWHDRNTWRTV